MKNKIITIAILTLLTSCGSITKNKTSSEVESEKNASKDEKTELATNTNETKKELEESTKNTLIDYKLSSYEFEPFDNTKPFFINGKKFENVKGKSKEENTNTSINETYKKQIETLTEKIENLIKTNLELQNEITTIKETTKDKETDYTNLILIVCGMFIFMFIFLLVFIHIQLKKNPLN